MNKCEWKKELVDGSPEKYVKTGLRFHPCDNFNPSVASIIEGGKEKRRYSICLSCKTEIHKPVPEKPLIVPSGKTWAMDFHDNDYIAIKTQIGKNCKKCDLYRDGICIINHCPDKFFYWKNFLNVRITDEIALYRPMVYLEATSQRRGLFDILVYVNVDQPMTAGGWTVPTRLATAKELTNEM